MLTICRLARLLSLSFCLALLAPTSKAETGGEPGKASEAVADPVASELARRLGETGPRAAVKSPEQRAALSAFYAARSYQPLWVRQEGLTAAAERIIAEIGRADEWGLDPADFSVPERGLSSGAGALVEAELKLGVAVLEYARHARGGRMDPTELSFSIDRTPPLLEPKRVLDEIAASDQPDQYLRKLHPQHAGFERLRQLYLALRSAPPAALPAAEEAAASGRANKSAKQSKAAARPEGASAQRVLLNMEQWRWMPEELGEMYVWVNIPEFTLRVVHNGEVIHSERVITGKPENQTPIFSDEMETVVFHPSWGVPNSIKVKELLPGLLRGSDTLTRNGLRAEYRGQRVDPSTIDWVSTDIRNLHIYQPPGADNVLGVVKFLFPNKHDVYMHDTPTKNLFNAEVRAFSHGCMRVRDPVRLAEIVMAYANGWSREQVAQQIKSGRQNNSIELSRHIPVHVTYFTVTVDDAGKAHYFRDIYGHERRIQMGLEGKAHLIAKKREDLGPVRAEIVSKYANSYGFGWNDTPDWIRRVFNN
ncbi:MAG TPA: L,D-transpeptidase family protein [Hyphomicrobiaceae bacterium]|nr:L,D-transpeptidase family protein [Hyphomicrobiaceae bacterium]